MAVRETQLLLSAEDMAMETHIKIYLAKVRSVCSVRMAVNNGGHAVIYLQINVKDKVSHGRRKI